MAIQHGAKLDWFPVLSPSSGGTGNQSRSKAKLHRHHFIAKKKLSHRYILFITLVMSIYTCRSMHDMHAIYYKELKRASRHSLHYNIMKALP